MTDKILYGKNELQGIVGLEVQDNICEIMVQKEDGSIDTVIHKNKFWILSDVNINGRFKRLDGDLHYKWGIQFEERNDFMKWRKVWKNMGKDVYSIFNEQEALMVKDGITFFKGLKFLDLSVLSVDIETTGLEHNDEAKVLLITNTFRKNGVIQRKLFAYDEYNSDKEFFEAWSAYVVECNPTVLVAHNGCGFDFPYLDFCASKCGAELSIGRDGSNLYFDSWESKFRKSQDEFVHYKKAHVWGRQIIDTMFLAIKYDIKKKYVSYGLKQIIKQEGLEKPGRVFYDAGQIRHKYLIPEEWQKIKDYCVDDGDDALSLFDLMGPPYFYLSQNIPKSLQLINESATGSVINSFLLKAYLQDGHSLPKATELTQHVQGGLSFAVPGIYRQVKKIDLRSAYPSQILRFKLHDPIKDPKAYFLEMVEHFAKARFQLKKLYKETNDSTYKDQDDVAKVFLNSAYGVTNTAGLNFNSPALAGKITLETRNVLGQSIYWASGKETQYWLNLFKEKTSG